MEFSAAFERFFALISAVLYCRRRSSMRTLPARLLHPLLAWQSHEVPRPRLIFGVLAIVAAGFANAPISAQTYDAENDFSTVSNPSAGGVWRYGWSEGLNGSLVLYDHFVPAPQYD